MTNSSYTESTQERDISESVLARTRIDGKRFLKSVWFVFSNALLVTLVASVAYFGLDFPELITAGAAILALTASVGGTFAFAFIRAPCVQRNEARRELAAVRETLSPRLRVVDVVKSFDLDERLEDAMIDAEYIRITVANQSNSQAQDCRVILTDMLPRLEDKPHKISGGVYQPRDRFRGYRFVPYPVELTWADHASEQRLTSRSIGPQAKAQADALSFWSNQGLSIAFASNVQRRQFTLPPTEVVFSVRVDSDSCLPYFYVLRYLPNASTIDSIKATEILYEGLEAADLDDYRIAAQ